MDTNALIERLESLGYLYVTAVHERFLTAVDPRGYQIEIKIDDDLVVDRKVGGGHWDIMFIGEESYL